MEETPKKEKNGMAEKMELTHEALPGYRPVFIVVFSLSFLYMAYILFQPCF